MAKEVKIGDPLTDREQEVLQLASEGKPSKEIATALFISKRTVDFHLGRAYQKMGVPNRVAATRMILTAQMATA